MLQRAALNNRIAILEQSLSLRAATTTPAAKPAYTPRGAAAELQRMTDGEIVISGPAGTGKSRACLEKLHRIASQSAGFRGLIVRKWRTTLSETGLVTYEDHVLGPEHPLVRDGKPRRQLRAVYRYPNGARIVIGGMDKKNKIMSSEYDAVFVQEATELEESDWNALTSRLRNNAIPFQQIIADCNPDTPMHWLYLRCQSSATVMLHSRHEDNPRLHSGMDWTDAGRAYLAQLDKLTGADLDRLRWGRWVQASGIVFDTWDEAGNVTTDADYQPGNGEIIWGVDDGYQGQRDPRTGLYTADSHPRVFVLAQLRPDGVLAVFAEHHAVKTLASDHVREVQASGYPPPSYASVDSSAIQLAEELRRRHGIPIKKGTRPVEESIKHLRQALAADDNGVRGVIVHPRCKLLRHEMQSYAYDAATGNPIKQYDHAIDALRYLWITVRKR